MVEPAWRIMQADDIDGVVAVAAIAFPDHFEDRACFEERRALFPQGCFVLANQAQVLGYVIAYPWPLGSIPPLNSLIGTLPESRETLYLHDLALLPATRGHGYAKLIVERLATDAGASGAQTIALVSVNGSVPFWQGLGFEGLSDQASLSRKLESYGDGAAYMTRQI